MAYDSVWRLIQYRALQQGIPLQGLLELADNCFEVAENRFKDSHVSVQKFIAEKNIWKQLGFQEKFPGRIESDIGASENGYAGAIVGAQEYTPSMPALPPINQRGQTSGGRGNHLQLQNPNWREHISNILRATSTQSSTAQVQLCQGHPESTVATGSPENRMLAGANGVNSVKLESTTPDNGSVSGDITEAAFRAHGAAFERSLYASSQRAKSYFKPDDPTKFVPIYGKDENGMPYWSAISKSPLSYPRFVGERGCIVRNASEILGVTLRQYRSPEQKMIVWAESKDELTNEVVEKLDRAYMILHVWCRYNGQSNQIPDVDNFISEFTIAEAANKLPPIPSPRRSPNVGPGQTSNSSNTLDSPSADTRNGDYSLILNHRTSNSTILHYDDSGSEDAPGFPSAILDTHANYLVRGTDIEKLAGGEDNFLGKGRSSLKRDGSPGSLTPSPFSKVRRV